MKGAARPKPRRQAPAADRVVGPAATSERVGLPALAAQLIARVDREHPADAVLRAALRSELRLSPAAAATLCRLVFGWFRWRGWFETERPASEQVREAAALAGRFHAAPDSFPPEELMQRAVPGWVREHVTITPGLARWLQTEPTLWLRARPGRGTELAAKLGHCEPAGPGAPAEALAYRGSEDLFRRPEFHAGEFEIQDLHSQAVGWICAPRPGETWWDACAGEGGKTLHLSDLMQNRGLIWASDAAAWRLHRLRLRARRAGVFNYRLAAWDGSERLPTRTRFDGVLVDAPCTNLGTWQRNPHARWTTTPGDVEELTALQRRLLEHAARAVKPGGRLIYAACTLTRAETEAVAEAFAQAHPDWEPLELRDPFTGMTGPRGRLWLDPTARPANGLFLAAWRRPGS